MDPIRLTENQYFVLAAVASEMGKGYGVSIRGLIWEETGRNLSFGRIYPILADFVERGWVSAHWGEKTEERGGRAKRHYEVTGEGAKILRDEEARRAAQAVLRPSGTLV